MALLSVAILVAADVNESTVRFRYTITLTPNGSGSVRVSLPAPVDGALMANLAASPGSSSMTVNRSGSEPALDVTLTERTTLTASFSGYRYSGPYDLTRADSMYACGSPANGCHATVSLFVISGEVREVWIVAQASWSRPCFDPSWQLDILATAGEQKYPASWPTAIC
jgi:hypothetical protein